MSLITAADVKAVLGITHQVDDTWLTTNIARIQKIAESYCKRTFEKEPGIVEYFDGDGRSTLLLSKYPVESITSIYDDPDREFNAEDLIESDDYVFYPLSGIIKLDGLITTPGIKNIKITYTAGYSSSGTYTPPEDLKMALIKLLIADYLELKGAVNKLEGDEISTKPYYLRRQGYTLLDPFVRMGI